MSVFRVEKNRNYTTMSNHHLRDMNLSNKARGLLSTMLSLPESWDYTARGLSKICKDGLESITTQLKEWEKCGYLERCQRRDTSGRMQKTEYIIYEVPRTAGSEPETVFPNQGNRAPGNPAQINKDKRIPDKSKVELKVIQTPHQIISTEGKYVYEKMLHSIFYWKICKLKQDTAIFLFLLY